MKAASKHSLECLGHEKEKEYHGWVQNLAAFSETQMDNFYYHLYSVVTNKAWSRSQSEFCRLRVRLAITKTDDSQAICFNFLDLRVLLCKSLVKFL